MGIQEKKSRVADKIIRAAVSLIGSHGFETVSMRQVAKEAGVGEATIYRYFPTKHALLFGYYDHLADRILQRLRTIDGFADYTFREQLQIFIHMHFDLLEPDRPFVKETYMAIFRGGFLQSTDEARRVREKGTAVIEDLIDAAAAAGEFVEPPMKKFISLMLLDTTIGLTVYWINDDSEGQESTLQFTDKAVAVVTGLLTSNLLGGLFDIGQFLFREHIVANFATSQARNFDFEKIKAQFTERPG